MLQQLFAIKDLQMSNFSSPFFSRGIPDAIRQVSTAANNPESLLNKYSHEFALYKLGELDDENGDLIPLPDPIQISLLSDLISQSQSKSQQNTQTSIKS